MTKQIFYSWQSDLKNSSNRTFIENCIKTAIMELKADKDFKIEVALDRDTKGLTGTPDIINSIFDKISNSELFIADISIINKDVPTRKTPNPNVLIELGYAARALGWDKVICIYNLDEGSFEDLPFDLRVRRPLSYSLASEQKKGAEKRIARIIADTIRQLQNEGKLVNEINDYIKVQFDSQILFIINQLLKILYGYEYSIVMKLDSMQKFLNLKKEDVREQFLERKLLGFQIFKSLKYARKNIEELIHQPIVVNELNRERLTPILSLIKHIGTFESINNDRIINDMFID
ncbi:MAG: hypothetical protein WCR52_24160, partial [Bacteroidota bacterium]